MTGLHWYPTQGKNPGPIAPTDAVVCLNKEPSMAALSGIQQNCCKSQMQIIAPNQWTEAWDPSGGIEEKLEEAEEEFGPMGRPTVSTDLAAEVCQTLSHQPDHIVPDLRPPKHTEQMNASPDIHEKRYPKIRSVLRPQEIGRSCRRCVGDILL